MLELHDVLELHFIIIWKQRLIFLALSILAA